MVISIHTKAKDGREFTREIKVTKADIEFDIKSFVRNIKLNDEEVIKIFFTQDYLSQW